MQQRVSLTFKDPPTLQITKINGIFAVSLHVARFMMLSGASETPIQFINKKLLNDNIDTAYVYGTKLNDATEADALKSLPEDVKITTQEEGQDLVELINKFTLQTSKESMAIVITFEQDDCLIIVGKRNEFYIINMMKKIFYVSESPIYDVGEYTTKKFKIVHLRAPPPAVESEPVVAVKKESVVVKKKLKTAGD